MCALANTNTNTNTHAHMQRRNQTNAHMTTNTTLRTHIIVRIGMGRRKVSISVCIFKSLHDVSVSSLIIVIISYALYHADNDRLTKASDDDDAHPPSPVAFSLSRSALDSLKSVARYNKVFARRPPNALRF